MSASTNRRAASQTARLVAAFRARASATWPELCSDPWAARLAGSEGAAFAAALDADQPHMELWIALRTAYLDRRVRALAHPAGAASQVVVLGAGLDTRAARLAHEGVTFFEVDTPASHADKSERLAALEGYPRGAASYVACDFEHEDFLEALGRAGFDPRAPSIFVWEGVTYYLDEAAVRATLERIAQKTHPHSVVLFDFVGTKMVHGQARHEEDQRTADTLRRIGEPLKFGTNDPLPLLYEAGFRRVRVISFDQLALNLTGTYERARKWRFQWMAEASVAAPVGWP